SRAPAAASRRPCRAPRIRAASALPSLDCDGRSWVDASRRVCPAGLRSDRERKTALLRSIRRYGFTYAASGALFAGALPLNRYTHFSRRAPLASQTANDDPSYADAPAYSPFLLTA